MVKQTVPQILAEIGVLADRHHLVHLSTRSDDREAERLIRHLQTGGFVPWNTADNLRSRMIKTIVSTRPLGDLKIIPSQRSGWFDIAGRQFNAETAAIIQAAIDDERQKEEFDSFPPELLADHVQEFLGRLKTI